MSAWKSFVTAALIGTEKSAPPALPGALETALASDSANAKPDANSEFLTRAGALALWRKSGWKPPHGAAAPAVSEPEEGAYIGGISAAHLRAMLGGRFSAVLPEWLEEVVRIGHRLPPELLPTLLDRARQERALRPHVFLAGGHRAQWLAAHNPDWSFATREEPELWETGNRDQRTAILRGLRARSPAEARAKLEAVWKTEPADARTTFLAGLATNLSEDDTAFLEAVLDDRSKEVRRVAVDLLARLPASPFVSRMIARATPLLFLKPGGLLSRASLEVTLPAEPDAAAARDGLDPKAFGQQKTLGEKAVLLMLMLSAVPLRHWTDAFSQTPAALLKAAEKNEFSGAIVTGWAWAAIRQRDIAWAEAFLDCPVQPHREFLPSESLLDILPENSRAERLAATVRAGALKKGDAEAWRSLAAHLNTFSGHWPPSLAREILAALRHASGEGIPWHLRGIAEAFLLRLPPSLLPGAVNGWPVGQEGVAALADLLAFRHDSLTALQQN